MRSGRYPRERLLLSSEDASPGVSGAGSGACQEPAVRGRPGACEAAADDSADAPFLRLPNLDEGEPRAARGVRTDDGHVDGDRRLVVGHFEVEAKARVQGGNRSPLQSAAADREVQDCRLVTPAWRRLIEGAKPGRVADGHPGERAPWQALNPSAKGPGPVPAELATGGIDRQPGQQRFLDVTAWHEPHEVALAPLARLWGSDQ